MSRPVAWIAAAFAVGIVLARWTVLTPFGWMLAAGACVLAWAAIHFVGGRAAPLLLISVMATGALWYGVTSLPPGSDSVLAAAGRDVTLAGTVIRPPESSRGRSRVVVAAEWIASRRGRVPARGLVQVAVRLARPVRYGDRIEVRGRLIRPPPAGNPGEFSVRDHLAAEGIVARLLVRSGTRVRVVGRARMSPVLAAAYALRDRMIGFFREAMPGPRGALMASLLLGDDGAISVQTREAFRRAGLLHVLVVSGAQVGLVLGSVLWLGRLLRAPPAGSAIAGALAVSFFALMAGWAPSVARAAIMALAGLGAMLLGRVRDSLAALAAASLVLLATRPALLFDAGFQLSFAATWALLYVAPALTARMPAVPRAVRSLLALTAAAQLGVMPLLAYHFLQVPLVGFAANLIVVPLVAVMVPAGFAVAAAGIVLPPVGLVLASLLGPLIDAVQFAAALFARLPLATVPYGPPSMSGCVAFFGTVVVVVESLRGRLRLSSAAVLAAGSAAVAVVVWGQVAAAASPARLVLTVLDVGQGDAIVVRAPSGRTMLIDAGGEVEGRLTGYDVGAQRVVPALHRLGVRAIDILVLSHPHEDHAGGLPAVVQNFRVGLLLDSGFPHPAPSYHRLLRLVEAKRIPYVLARRGMRIDLGAGAVVSVLHPDPPLIVGTGSDINLNSVVLRLSYGRTCALLTGDIEALIEYRLLDSGDDLRCAVLKVAHHGSGTSSRAEFLEAVAPAVAVISAGAFNPFGHPHASTLDALAAVGARVYRTDRHGAITIESDGRQVWIRTVRDAGDD